jgi:Tfp pilus assembly protein PilZ
MGIDPSGYETEEDSSFKKISPLIGMSLSIPETFYANHKVFLEKGGVFSNFIKKQKVFITGDNLLSKLKSAITNNTKYILGNKGYVSSLKLRGNISKGGAGAGAIFALVEMGVGVYEVVPLYRDGRDMEGHEKLLENAGSATGGIVGGVVVGAICGLAVIPTGGVSLAVCAIGGAGTAAVTGYIGGHVGKSMADDLYQFGYNVHRAELKVKKFVKKVVKKVVKKIEKESKKGDGILRGIYKWGYSLAR